MLKDILFNFKIKFENLNLNESKWLITMINSGRLELL